MQKVTIKIDGSEQEVNVLNVFAGINPKTQRRGVYLTYTNKIGKQRGVQLFCEDEYSDGPASELVKNIREGKITDLTGYLTERG